MEKTGKTPDPLGGFSPGDISSAIAKLREHPEIISAVSSALSGSFSSPKETKPEGMEAPSETAAAESSVSAIPSEKISQVMATLAPMFSEVSKDSRLEKEITGSREEHRYALLCALRPYLSRERREMVDYILKFGKIGELLKKIK
jgi:hypothetical protein